MLVFMYPGQGSQKRGMGAELFDTVPEFYENENRIDEILGFSVREICSRSDSTIVSQTQYTQPCLYTVNALYGFNARQKGLTPTAAIGHSLGEYNALMTAGGFDFITGLEIVKKRGELMAEQSGGTMLAVLGLGAEKLQQILNEKALSDVEIANFNSNTQIIISGPNKEIENAIPVLLESGANNCIPLNVSAAFHSKKMRGMASTYRAFLSKFKFNFLKIPVISNVTGYPFPILDNPDEEIKDLLVRQLYEPVQWVKSIKLLLSIGHFQFNEMGPGDVLTKLNTGI